MDISVIVCTFNRHKSLARTLDSLVASTLPASVEWEVIVVDNNSTDATPDLVRRYADAHPSRVRYVFEATQGKSYSLNKAVRGARGAILAFADDDVVVEPTWMWKLTQPLIEGRWSGVGGRVIPEWAAAPPRWIPFNERYGLAPLGVFNLGTAAGPLTEAPFGCNMAFRRSMFETHGLFRVDLGPCETSDGSPWQRGGLPIWTANRPPRMGEDSEFCQRLLDRGEALYYEPAAVVHHWVAADRLRKQYFLAWWFEKGRAEVRQVGAKPGTRLYLGRIPAYHLRSMAVWTARWLLGLGPRNRFRSKLLVWKKLGETLEFYRGMAKPPSGPRAEQAG